MICKMEIHIKFSKHFRFKRYNKLYLECRKNIQNIDLSIKEQYIQLTTILVNQNVSTENFLFCAILISSLLVLI